MVVFGVITVGEHKEFDMLLMPLVLRCAPKGGVREYRLR